MIVNRAAIAAIFVNIRTTFAKALAGAKPRWDKLAERVVSEGSEETYGWLDDFPMMKKWVGEKVVKMLGAHGYTIKNDNFEATIGVKKHDIADDKTGQLAVKAKAIGKAAALWPDKLVFDLLPAGFLSPCYDGQFFFDTDHPVAGASVSNKSTVELSNANLAAATASYGAARQAMMDFKNDDGESLEIVPNLLVVPPALETVANMLMTNDKLADGTPNPFKGQCEVLVVPRLSAKPKQWFLFDVDQPLKPLIFQERQSPTPVEQTGEDNDDVFNKGLYKFGVEARGSSGYAFWQMAYGSDPA